MKPPASINSALMWLIVGAMCFLLVSVRPCRAERFLIDDFSDGDDVGWTRINTNVGETWGPGSFDPTSQAYQFSTPGIVPSDAPARGVMYSVWDPSSDPLYTNGLVRVKVRADQLDSVASIFFRFTGDLISGVNLYAFSAFGARGFGFDRFEGGQETRDLNVPDLVMGLGEDWWMEAGAVDDQLSMKVWRDGELEPTLPQLVFTDTALTSGAIALNANLNFGTDTEGPVNSTFDDVYFTAFGVAGDFDKDSDTDGTDFLSWQRGESQIPLSSSDLANWQANYGAASSLAATQAVPEPTGILLISSYVVTIIPCIRKVGNPMR